MQPSRQTAAPKSLPLLRPTRNNGRQSAPTRMDTWARTQNTLTRVLTARGVMQTGQREHAQNDTHGQVHIRTRPGRAASHASRMHTQADTLTRSRTPQSHNPTVAGSRRIRRHTSRQHPPPPPARPTPCPPAAHWDYCKREITHPGSRAPPAPPLSCSRLAKRIGAPSSLPAPCGQR